MSETNSSTRGTSKMVRLTERVVTAAQPLQRHGTTAFRILRDTQRQGFALRVSASGAKSYVVIRRVPGALHPVNFKFGNAGEMTVAEARVEAETLLARMARGENPAEDRREQRVKAKQERVRGITLREAAKLAFTSARAKGRTEKTLDEYEATIERYLADWLDRPLVEISREDARKKHQAIARQVAAGKFSKGRKRKSGMGRDSANRAFRVFRVVWNRAVREHPELPTCPVVNVDWHAVKPVRTALSPETLPEWYAKVIASENHVRRDYLLFLLFSGMRRSAAAEMKWRDVNFETRTLRVPNPKGGEERAFDLPLSDFMIELLKRRKAEHDKVTAGEPKMKPWVWPAASESGHIVEVREPGITMTIHSLRRSFITCATAWCKLHVYDVKLLVNHTLPTDDITALYVKTSVEQVRGAMQTITDTLRALCEKEPVTKNVLPMRRKRAA